MLPRLLHFGNFGVPSYGVLVALGVVIGLLVTVRLARQQGLDPDRVWNLGIIVVLGALIGAKLFLIVDEWYFFRAHPREIWSLGMLQAGGVFHGGLLAALLISVWYLRRHHMPWLKTADVFAPGLAIGHVFGRLGCFAAGCCYGKPTSL